MLTRDDLLEIETRYHRADWDGFRPETAVFDIGRLMGHITELQGLVEVEREMTRHTRDKMAYQFRQATLLAKQVAALEAHRDELQTALAAAARAAVAASDRIDHDISYQGVLCAIVPVQEWRALAALIDTP